MLILEYAKKKGCRGSNGVGYCPFPVLCCDIVVLLQEGWGAHSRRVCVQDKGPLRARRGVPGEGCRDRVGTPCVVTRRWVAGALGVTT